MNNRDKAAATTRQPCRLARGRERTPQQSKYAAGLALTNGTDMKSPRFRALMALAQEGEENAIGDLWREFNFDFHKEGSGHE